MKIASYRWPVLWYRGMYFSGLLVSWKTQVVEDSKSKFYLHNCWQVLNGVLHESDHGWNREIALFNRRFGTGFQSRLVAGASPRVYRELYSGNQKAVRFLEYQLGLKFPGGVLPSDFGNSKKP